VFSLTTVDDVPALSLDMNGDGTVDTVVLSEEAKEVVSYDILRQTISALPTSFSKPLLVQVKVSEALHKRGAVIAEKAILFAIQKEIEKHDCELVKGKKGKKPVCIEKTDVLEISAILDAMIENLDTPIRERKDDIHTHITELKEDLKRFFSRR